MNLCIVIPTRNRSDIIRYAVESALSIKLPDTEIIVSDNSTDPVHLERNEAFCRGLGAKNLRYVRPPEPLGLTDHWNFALGQTDAEYVTVQSDRTYVWADPFKTGFREMVARDSETLTFTSDEIIEFEGLGLRLCSTYPESGTFVELSSRRLLEDIADARFPIAVPRLCHSIVRRSLLERIRALSGRYCSGVAPDNFFACMALTQVETILHYQTKAFTGHSSSKSTGAAGFSGRPNEAYRDFLAKLGGAMLHPSPYPELLVAHNGVIASYLTVVEIVGAEKMPPINWDIAKRRFIRSVELMYDGPFKQQQWEWLIAYGLVSSPMPHHRRRKNLRRYAVDAFGWAYARAPRVCHILELGAARVCAIAGMRLPLSPQAFESIDQALAYRRSHPGPLISGYVPYDIANIKV